MKTLALFLLLSGLTYAQYSPDTYCADAGVTDSYACTLVPSPVAYVTGQTYYFKANTANTGAASINFNALGAKTIVKVAGGVPTTLANNDILAGQIVVITYDGTNMQIQSTLGNAPTGATTNQNIRTIGASFGSFQSGATALSAAATACVPTYFAGTIQSVEIIGDVSGSATIDVKTVAHSSWTGTASATSITAADIPALTAAARYTDSTLTGWTTSVTAGTDFCFVMTSPTTVAGLSITVKVAAN